MSRIDNGKRVTSIDNIKYGGSVGVVLKGSQGTVCDVGSVSGDPIVKWDNQSYGQTVVQWVLLKEIAFLEPNYTVQENITDQSILQGILNVERGNIRYSDPNGSYPRCVPKVGRSGVRICEHCGNPICSPRVCPSVDPENRWSILRQILP